MNKTPNKFDEFIDNYPRESLQLGLVLACFIWLTPVSLLSGMMYLLLSKIFKVRWWVMLSIGVLIALELVGVRIYQSGHFDLHRYIREGFAVNKLIWRALLRHQGAYAFHVLMKYGMDYMISLPVLFAGILNLCDLMKDNPHKKMIDALQRGEHIHHHKELSDKQIEKSIKKVDESKYDGTVLGVSRYTGKPAVIPDHFVNQIVLVLGTTGSGKTITLRRFYGRAIRQGYPLIVVDGKPTEENVNWLQSRAKACGKPFYGFNCGDYAHYDALSDGGYTELKDKIISLKDEWENDYYRSIAEDYLQAVFQVLLQKSEPFDLKRVVQCLDHGVLQDVVREMNDPVLAKRIGMLVGYDKKDITGLQAHLSLLIHSELGEYFTHSDNEFSLKRAIAENAIVYFALPALRFPSFSKVLGKLVINDLKAIIDRQDRDHKRVFMVFDEFSVFAGEQVLNLVNMGRGKGVHAIFGTQGLADLNRVDDDFKSQVLNCANTIICHRLNDQESAEAVAGWMGTQDTFTVTAQFDLEKAGAGLGSIKADKGYIVHPEQIKQGLRTGDAFWASKVGSGRWGKVRVWYQTG